MLQNFFIRCWRQIQDNLGKSKLAFEKFALSHGVHIKHYHADNGRFKDNLFIKSIEDKGQTISFCGVGAHHQNGIAEKRIGDLQRRATALLLHAQRRWPDAINTHLWTYAISAANDSRNYTPTNENLKRDVLYFHWQHNPSGIKNCTIQKIYNATLHGYDNFDKMVIATSRPKNLRDLYVAPD